MAFIFSRSGGTITEPAAILMPGSGVIRNGMAVEFSRTGGLGAVPAGASTTFTAIFGIAHDYIQGASDAQVRVTPIVSGQLWLADCTDAATTAQVGLRHALNATGTEVRNTASDVATASGLFRAVAVVGATTGSGKLLGFFETGTKAAQNSTTLN